MNDSLIIHGPQGCGKSRNAKQLAAHFGLTRVVEWDESPEPPRFTDTLYLTSSNDVRGNKIRAVPFSDAMRQAGLEVAA